MERFLSLSKAVLGALEKPFAATDMFLFFIRIWIAKIFFTSGLTKMGDGLFVLDDSAVLLFEYEYGFAEAWAEVMARLAMYAEVIFPLLLVLGLGARFGAAGLIGVTVVIQFFVYPGSYAEHLTWFAALLPIFLLGPGKLSIDHIIRHKYV